MKKLVLYLFVVLIASQVWGQSLPKVVDNSKYFPPAAAQSFNDCSQFSLIYYLKSYLWNKYFNRDPKLAENQFCSDFVWNQTIGGLEGAAHFSQNEPGYELMSKQGCATVKDFPLQINQENIPDLDIRGKGLRYRSKALHKIWTYRQDSVATLNFISGIKDSIARGNAMTIHFPIFSSFHKMKKNPAIYNCYPGTAKDSMIASHYVAIVGYDDTIKTLTGRGAFKAINSGGMNFGDNGFFYLDYNWLFLIKWWGYTFTFIEEDFNYAPEFCLKISLLGVISGDDQQSKKNIFVDSVDSKNGKRFDFEDYNHYYYYPNFIRVKKINASIANNSLIYVPLHNHDGNREIIFDLTDNVKANSFKSMEIVINDPLSSTYEDNIGNIIYSFNRKTSGSVSSAAIDYLNLNKKINGKVHLLSDTTVISYDFYSYPLGFHKIPVESDGTYVKKCTSTFRRILITFDVNDTTALNSAPIFTSEMSDTTIKEGKNLTFKYEGYDPDMSQTTFSLISGPTGAYLDGEGGIFNWTPNFDQAGTYQITVVISDGVLTDTSKAVITVANVNRQPKFTSSQRDTSVIIGDSLTINFKATDPDKGAVLKYLLVSASQGCMIDSLTGKFSWTPDSTQVGDHKINIIASDGALTDSAAFVVSVKLFNHTPYFVQKPDTLAVYKDSTVTFQFLAEDPDKDSLWYSVQCLGASIDRLTGLFTYKSSNIGCYPVIIIVTDGQNNVADTFFVKVSNITSVEDFEIPTEYSLKQNFPNPFNPSTSISFSLPQAGYVILKVFNILGEELKILVDREFGAGNYSVVFTAKNLASGIYIYVLKTKDFTSTRKMFLMK